MHCAAFQVTCIVYCQTTIRAHDLSIAFTLLSVLIALFPVVTISDGLASQSLAAALAALIMAAAAIAARTADVQFAGQVTRRLGLAVALPAVWMVVQLLPMPFPALAHTIWTNGHEALDQKAWGHISVDLGKTLGALATYLANIALVLACILVARDYQRAGRLLIMLGAITALTILVLLTDRIFHLFAFASGSSQDSLGAASALGLVLSLAIGVFGLERGGYPTKSGRTLLFLSGAGMLICVTGLAGAANLNIAVLAAFGAATFLSTRLARSLRLARWTTAVLLATLVAAAMMIVAWRFDTNSTLSPLLQFASRPASSLAVAQRLLADTGWLGSGASTYDVLLPIYQDFSNTMTQPPSTTVALVVGLGWPMVLIIIGIGLSLIVRLYGGALARGRDSFYAAAAASAVIVLLGEAFCDASLLNAGVAATADVLIGTGLAQSVSRVDMA